MARRELRTLDAHVAGQTVRLVAGGLSAPRGVTMKARLADARRRLDDARVAVTCEPRGHADLVGALLAEATDPTAHAGLLSFDATDWRSPSTVIQMAALRLAIDRGLLTIGDPGASLVVDTPAGVRALRLGPAGQSPRSASPRPIMGGSCATLSARVNRGGRRGRDCAGGLRAIVDAEAVGLSLVTLERGGWASCGRRCAGPGPGGYAAPLKSCWSPAGARPGRRPRRRGQRLGPDRSIANGEGAVRSPPCSTTIGWSTEIAR